MKVVHIGDSDGGGGAANAMSRLHEALRRVGVDSRLLVRTSVASGSEAGTVATRGDADELFPAVREAIVRQYVEQNRTSLTNTHFSVHVDGADVSRLPVVAASDVVHLHWTASMLTPADVAALSRAKPVVWTLHDLEPLTGGCHFPAGCEGYVAECAACPQLVRDPFRITAMTLRDKKMLWAGEQPTFVAPSLDIAERARRSAVARHARASVVHIPHGIDVDVFRPKPKDAARRALGLPGDGLYVLCGSNYNAETRKGMRFLNGVLAAATAALPRLQFGQPKLKLLTVGEPKLDLSDLDGVEIIQLGRVSVDMMPSVHAAADIFLHPSVEDNFPCMVLEALSCGVPVVAFDIGGVADIVRDQVCGRLVAAGDERAMAVAVSALVGDPQRLADLGARARTHVEEHFGDIPIARMHADLYEAVAAERRAAPHTRTSRIRKAGIDEIFPRWSTACLVQELAFVRERVSLLAEGSRANSQRLAALQREAAESARTLADRSRQVEEKESELIAIHAVAREREALTERLHASAAAIESRATALQQVVEERDDLREKLQATFDEQRAELELVRRVAAERRLLIEDLHRASSERVAALSRQIQEKEAELAAIHEVAEKRGALVEHLHASAASIEGVAASLQREVRVRDDLLAKLEATIKEQRSEIELIHRIAADRQQLVEQLHRVAEERAAVIERLSALADAPQ